MKNKVTLRVDVQKDVYSFLNKWGFDFERNIQEYLKDMCAELLFALQEYEKHKGLDTKFENKR